MSMYDWIQEVNRKYFILSGSNSLKDPLDTWREPPSQGEPIRGGQRSVQGVGGPHHRAECSVQSDPITVHSSQYRVTPSQSTALSTE